MRERGRRRRLLVDVPRPENGAVHPQSFHHERPDLELGAGACLRRNHHDAPEPVRDVDVHRQIRAPDEVDGHVDRARRREDLVRERGRIEVTRSEHGVVETERSAPVELRSSARRADDRASPCVRELDRGGADARARSGHEHHLTGLCGGLRHHRVVRGDEHLGYTAGGHEVEPVGHGDAVRRRDRHELGLTAASHEPEHPVTDVEGFDPGAESFHNTRELQAGDVLRHAGRRGVGTGALRKIATVDPRPVNPDEHFSRLRNRSGPGLDDELAVGDDDGTHVARRYRPKGDGTGARLARRRG
jgi:hypothetical protein